MWKNNGKKKVLFITRKDFAGSGVDLCDAINECSDVYESRLVAYLPPNFGVKSDIICDSKKSIQKMIDSADIVHFKGDEPVKWFKGLDFKGKPLFQTVGGSNFRKMKVGYIREVATQIYNSNDYKDVNLSSITPELTDNWIPHAYDVIKNEWKTPTDKVLIGHSPSDRAKKGTHILIEAVKQLENVELVLMENMSNKDVLEAKKNIHLFVDQLIVDAYGKSAIECMAMGVPVISSCMNLDKCPVFKIESQSVENLVDVLKEAISKLNKTTSNKFFKWAKDTHSKQSVCKKLESFYLLKPKFYVKKSVLVKVKMNDSGLVKYLKEGVANELIKCNKCKLV